MAEGPVHSTLLISATPIPSWSDPRGYLAVIANGLAPTATNLPTPGLADAIGRMTSDGAGGSFYLMAVASDGHVSTLMLLSTEPPSTVRTDFLIDVAKRQQVQAGGAPPPPEPAPEGVEAELDQLLVAPPPQLGLMTVAASSKPAASTTTSSNARARIGSSSCSTAALCDSRV